MRMITVLRAPALSLAPGAAEAASEHVLLLLPQITLLDQQLRDVSRRIKQILKNCANAGNPDVPVMLSIPGVGPGITATLLSEASRPLRERDYHSLRCFAGARPSPSKVRSGEWLPCARHAVQG
jgi:transposase